MTLHKKAKKSSKLFTFSYKGNNGKGDENATEYFKV